MKSSEAVFNKSKHTLNVQSMNHTFIRKELKAFIPKGLHMNVYKEFYS